MAPATAMCFLLIASAISLEASHNAEAARYVITRLLRSFIPILVFSLVLNGAADILVIQTMENRGLAIAFSTTIFSIIICGVLIMISRRVSRLIDRSIQAQRQSEALALEQSAH